MSDDPELTEDELERRRLARVNLAAAVAEWVDAYDVTAGALVTGYVAIAEATGADRTDLIWATGNGAEPSEERSEGLYSWRVEGMLRKAIRDICEGRATHQ